MLLDHTMEWLPLVGSLKWYVSFAKYRFFCRVSSLLQKIVSSLVQNIVSFIYTYRVSFIYIYRVSYIYIYRVSFIYISSLFYIYISSLFFIYISSLFYMYTSSIWSSTDAGWFKKRASICDYTHAYTYLHIYRLTHLHTHTHIYTETYTYMHKHMYTRIHTSKSMYLHAVLLTYTHPYIQRDITTSVVTHVCIFVSMCVRTHVWVMYGCAKYPYMSAYTHTYENTYMRYNWCRVYTPFSMTHVWVCEVPFDKSRRLVIEKGNPPKKTMEHVIDRAPYNYRSLLQKSPIKETI